MVRRGDRNACKRKREDEEEHAQRAPLREARHLATLLALDGLTISESCPPGGKYNPGCVGV
jgi:hypothetical protein